MKRTLHLQAIPAALAVAAVLVVPARAAAAGGPVVERFERNPLTGQSFNPFFPDGDVDGHFAYLPGEPPHFPGDRAGSLRVLYDTTVPAGRLATPLGRMLSIDDGFSFGAILTIRSEGFEATPDGFDQIAFGLWNASTTGVERTGFPSDSFDLIEFDYFPNVSPAFGGPFLSPTAFGGDVGGNAFNNFAFASTEVALPLDVPLLCQAEYAASTRRLTVTVSRLGPGTFVETTPVATITADLSGVRPGFLANSLGIAAYFEGFLSLRAEVDYDLLYFGPLPRPWGRAARGAKALLSQGGPGRTPPLAPPAQPRRPVD